MNQKKKNNLIRSVQFVKHNQLKESETKTTKNITKKV
jgi:hypothetical protein